MNLNRKIIEKNCEEFFALYDFTRDNIRRMCERKIIHTRSVAGNCDLLAKELGLEPYDCDRMQRAKQLPVKGSSISFLTSHLKILMIKMFLQGSDPILRLF